MSQSLASPNSRLIGIHPRGPHETVETEEEQVVAAAAPETTAAPVASNPSTEYARRAAI
jgi:hypothetical protein